MKSSKESWKMARHLLRLSFTDGRLDQQKVTHMVQSVLSEKPRHHVDILKDYQRLLRLEVERRHAIIESATPLNGSMGERIVANLRTRYGDDLTTEFRTNPELLGGLRIKIGDDVWDGSVRHRLNQLQEQM